MNLKEVIGKTAKYAAYVFVGLLIYDGAKHAAKWSVKKIAEVYARPVDEKVIEEAVGER